MLRSLPINLVVEGRSCVVIGAGAVAEGRVQQLASRGAYVTVIAPEITPDVRSLAAAGQVALHERAYQPGDLDGAFFAVCGTDDARVNEAVWREAEERGVLVNCVDDTPHCSAMFASIVQRGKLQISISTDGAAPALAVRIRERLEREFGAEYAELLEILADARPMISGRGTPHDRKRLWYEIVDSDVLDLIRDGHADRARERVRALIASV